MKLFLRCEFIYFLSLVALAYHLSTLDYWRVVSITDPLMLVISLLCLLAGFLSMAKAWQYCLTESSHRVSFRHVFTSLFLFNASKYIPGKVAYIYAVTDYLSRNLRAKKFRLVKNFFVFTSLYSISGLIVGIVSIRYLQQNFILFALTSLIACLILLIWLVKKQGNRYRLLNYTAAIKWMLLLWLFWGGAYAFFMNSVGLAFSIQHVFSFPLAASLGNLAFFAPGGLGVREAVLSAALHAEGLTLNLSISLAASARVWFLIGEIAVLIAASVCAYVRNKELASRHRSSDGPEAVE